MRAASFGLEQRAVLADHEGPSEASPLLMAVDDAQSAEGTRPADWRRLLLAASSMRVTAACAFACQGHSA